MLLRTKENEGRKRKRGAKEEEGEKWEGGEASALKPERGSSEDQEG